MKRTKNPTPLLEPKQCRACGATHSVLPVGARYVEGTQWFQNSVYWECGCKSTLTIHMKNYEKFFKEGEFK